MFQLKLFGGLSLEDDSGVHTGKAAQRRRLAVLALLETAPRRTLTRDKLVALLWAEEDTEHARHRLSVVLHELRKVLGDDALRSIGDDVTLNSDMVGSDVAQFSAALAAERYTEAVGLYGGPFMDGVHLSSAPEFERWVDSERTRWESEYRRALENVARGLEGRQDWRAAAETWRKLASNDAFNTRVTLAYMNALARAGDTATALQVARVHEVMLREELGATPGPELQALVGRIERGEIVQAAPVVVSPNVAPAAPVSVAPQPLVSHTPADRAPLPRKPHTRFRRSQRSTVVTSVLVMLLVFVVFGLIKIIIRDGNDGKGNVTAGPAQIVVGILPFTNISDNPANNYLSEGLTEEIISALGRVGLSVPSGISVGPYATRADKLTAAARDLNARYLIEGSVRRAGDALRITVRMVDAGSGLQIWTRTYDRNMEDIFQVQTDIAQAVVEELQSRLPTRLAQPKIDYTTTDPQAYELYLRGRAMWLSRDPNRFEHALKFFQQAIARDSTYARAYAGIADVYNMLGAYNYGLMPPAKAYPQARAAAAHALRLDPNLAEAHAAMGNYLYNYEWNWSAAEEELRRAVAINPGYSMARHWLELVLLISGKHAEALQVIRKAREQDPRSPLISSALAHHYYYRRELPAAIAEYNHALELDSTFLVARIGLAMSYTAAGQHERAIQQMRSAVRIVGPNVPVTQAVLGYVLGAAGQQGEARQILAQLQRMKQRQYIAPHFFSLVYLGLRDHDRALAALGDAYQERSGALLYMKHEAPLDPVRNDPRYQNIMRRVSGTGEQRAASP